MKVLTKVTCDIEKDLFTALEKAGVKSKKEFCEGVIKNAIHAKVQDVLSKEKMINDFINI